MLCHVAPGSEREYKKCADILIMTILLPIHFYDLLYELIR